MTSHPTDEQRAKEYASRYSTCPSGLHYTDEAAFLAGATSVRREAEELVRELLGIVEDWGYSGTQYHRINKAISKAESFLGEKK